MKPTVTREKEADAVITGGRIEAVQEVVQDTDVDRDSSATPTRRAEKRSRTTARRPKGTMIADDDAGASRVDEDLSIHTIKKPCGDHTLARDWRRRRRR